MDLTESYKAVVPHAVRDRYELRETRNAAAILASTNPVQSREIIAVLSDFSLLPADLIDPGGNESRLAARLNRAFHDLGWREYRHDTEVTSVLRVVPYRPAGETKVGGLVTAERLLEQSSMSARPERLTVAPPLRADIAAPRMRPLPEIDGGWRTVYADPPWRFINRTGKVAPEHRRLDRYDTMTTTEICTLQVADVVSDQAHLYLWVPNALLPEGLQVMESWGFRYVSNIVWAKRRKDGGPDGRGVGFYFRNVTELILFGVRGSMRTLAPGRRQVNIIETRKREHSRKPDEAYEIIESCSPGPHLELFARYPRPGWTIWGDEASPDIMPRGRQWPAYR